MSQAVEAQMTTKTVSGNEHDFCMLIFYCPLLTHGFFWLSHKKKPPEDFKIFQKSQIADFSNFMSNNKHFPAVLKTF